MPLYYVWSPFTGTVTSCCASQGWKYCGDPPRQSYCDGPTHPRVACDGPIDIGTGGNPGVVLHFWGSSNIKSINVSRSFGVCGDSNAYPQNRKLAVALYSATGAPSGAYIATAYYMHVNQPIADGVYNTVLQPNGLVKVSTLGAVPGWCSDPPNYNCSGCYGCCHVHMERCDGGRNNPDLCCQSSVIGGGNWIYEWTR